MIIVSDTSAFSCLIRINRLNLLHDLFEMIIIPEKVREEIREMSNYGWDLSLFENAAWIEVKSPEDVELVKRLQVDLDDGEAEAIALAVELEAERLLIDERKGSAIAKSLGIKAIGLIAVLIEAKVKGIVPQILPVLDELREKGGFWLSNRFYNEIRKMVDE